VTSVEEAHLAQAAERLVACIEASIAEWVERAVEEVVTVSGGEISPALREAAVAAGREARRQIPRAVGEVVRRDPDEQRATPLQVLRGAARYPTDVLVSFAVPARRRDRDAEARFPADVYDLVPAAFADLGPDVGEAGLVWGAARARVHQARHRISAADQEISEP
jgi:hypothetical protein